ncbi:MAG: hydroxyacylglutathione hydrolase [Actinomycetota bacterium]|nr:hydroxyacylglutathione hydrolase [Actinomycetota bacterium]
MVDVITIETPGLGDRSYLVTDGEVAVAIDPQRDIDRFVELLESRRLRLTHVLETHVHNDYVTGGYQLARTTGAAYVLNALDRLEFEHTGVVDGDVLEVSRTLRIRVLGTPGHTFTHLSYAVDNRGETIGVFTGGSVLYGSTGRPDLLGSQYADELARHQHTSARRLLEQFPATTPVYPTHGFGSFCAATQTEGTSSTLGDEALRNPALTLDVEDFVTQTLQGLDEYPAYYVRMAPANSAGPGPVDLSPPTPADAVGLRARIEAGEWVVDLRSGTAFAAGHVPGTLNFSLDGPFVTYLGWLLPWGTPVTLLGRTAEHVAEAQRELVRIGVDRPAAAATGEVEEWSDRPVGSFPVTDMVGLREHLERHREHRTVVLDVRLDLEYLPGHLPGAVHIPLHELLERLDDVPPGQIWVHCASGYRASIAASVLAAAGRDVVAIDDDFSSARGAGLDVVPAAAV